MIFVAGYCLKQGDDAAKKLYEGDTLRKALHSCLENAPQTVLQMYVIISTFNMTGIDSKCIVYKHYNEIII